MLREGAGVVSVSGCGVVMWCGLDLGLAISGEEIFFFFNV